MPTYKKIGFILGPILFLIILNLPFTLINPIAHKVIAGAIWMIVWWLSEAVSISVTALIPLAIFPLLGIADIKEISANYANPIVFLFLGGFIIALALEKVELHKRIALNIIRLTGTNANGVVLGFMLATALMSMWISNTASTVVMLPIAASVIKLLIDDADGFTKNDKNFALSIMLGIAFSANIGGTATLIGTPPNSVMAAFLETTYDIEIGFMNWMLLGVPFAMVMLIVCYFVLVKWFYPNNLGQLKSSDDLILNELKKLGKMSKGEKVVSFIFALTALSWIFRTNLNGWFPDLNLSDAGISMLGALAMFVAPLDFKNGDFTLKWEDTRNLPWGILILFGGGLALAGALKSAGMIDLIGNTIAGYEGISTFVITVALIGVMLFMTELMSNIALTAVFVPVVAGIAIGLEVPILLMVIPVTLAASCAFMLPMATPPNAIVFASGHIKVHEMARVGIVLNVIAVGLLVLLTYTVLPSLF
ncbi:MAG: sodium-dependent dicarboxylate transporter 2/3/5 [Saprospiraceae bacterium]|jgi:sodium-dependent dicarboxylate transporter 2/3/5